MKLIKKGFELRKEDDETLEVFLNGKEVGHANHDSDGWSGMESLESLVERVAEVLGLSVVRT